MLTDVDRRSPSSTEVDGIRRKVSRHHGNFTEGHMVGRKDDGRCQKVLWPKGIESLLEARKV